MTWQKTVMSDEKIYEVALPYADDQDDFYVVQFDREIAKAQAEITGDIAFKAGFKEALNTVVATREYDAGFKAGIQKVVEFIETNHGELGTIERPTITINGLKWQSKLKEWGIDRKA